MNRVLLGIAMQAIVLSGGYCLAETGYRNQYDFEGQGIDSYAGEDALNPRYDFFRPDIETYSNGNDFDLGYAISTDHFGFGPPVDLTNTSQYEYFFLFSALPIRPYDHQGGGGGDPECNEHSDCVDTNFCNGEEFCVSGRCGSGAPPNCSDGILCTLDYCNDSTDMCRNVPLSDPGEVSGLTLRVVDPATTVAVLDWFSRPISDSYNVYRAGLADLSDLHCQVSGVLATTVADDRAVAPGELLLYLVTSVGCGGESTLGTASSGVQRTGTACHQ